MPLIQGSSKDAIRQNTETEITQGNKSPDQAYAIANAIARKIKAKGVQDDDAADKPAPVAGGY